MKYWVFAKLCRLAYKSEKRIEEELKKMGFEEKPTHISIGEFRCFIIGNGIRQYIVFKGTDSWEEWLNNLNYKLVDTGVGFKAHLGIWEIANKFYSILQSKIDKERYVYFIGHSLGGGLAVFNSVLAKKDCFTIVKVPVFGCPRIGDKDLANYLFEKRINVVRFQNNLDLVTQVPPYIKGYRDIGSLIYINRNNKIKENASNLYLIKDRLLCYLTLRYTELATDHRIQRYLDILRQGDY